MVISKGDEETIENEIIYNLSAPYVPKDYSWTKPGQVNWEWWYDARPYGVDFHSGYGIDSYKYCIDLASGFDIPYTIMDESWAKNTCDPLTLNSTISLPKSIQYGKE